MFVGKRVHVGINEGFAGFLGEIAGTGAFAPEADDRKVDAFEQRVPAVAFPQRADEAREILDVARIFGIGAPTIGQIGLRPHALAVPPGDVVIGLAVLCAVWRNAEKERLSAFAGG